LVLKFSEVYFNEVGEKVFDVALGKKVVVKGLDIFSKVGKATAHDEFVEFELKDDMIYVNGEEASGAYEPKNKLVRIRFVKGGADNPKINAILIIRGELKDTDYAEKKKVLDDVKKKKMQTLKQSQLLNKRHSSDEENDDIADDNSEEMPQNDDVTPLSIFFTINGVYIFTSLLIFAALYRILDSF